MYLNVELLLIEREDRAPQLFWALAQPYLLKSWSVYAVRTLNR